MAREAALSRAKPMRQAAFVGGHVARVLALVYQRYLFFGILGAAGFGLASMAVAPALFAVTFFTMVTGELVIALRSRPRTSAAGIDDALKYVMYVEAAASLASMILLVAAVPLLPGRYADIRGPWLVAVFIVPASAFSQIALNWALVGGHRTLYGSVFYVEAAVILLTSRTLVEWFGMNAVALAYCIRPLVTSACIVGGLGFTTFRRSLARVLSQGDARRGRYIHSGAAHQVGSLIVKSAWSSLDVLMVGGLAGETGAGHYRILKTLATVPSVAISPAWSWLRPDIASAVQNGQYTVLVRQIIRYSLLLSVPAVIMLLVPADLFERSYRVVFPKDALPGDVLKYSMVLWWFVASSSGWVRSVTVATGQFHVSTYGNVAAFAVTFLIGPALVLWAGFNALYIVPGTLVGLNVYWFWYLAKLYATGPAAAAVAVESRTS